MWHAATCKGYNGTKDEIPFPSAVSLDFVLVVMVVEKECESFVAKGTLSSLLWYLFIMDNSFSVSSKYSKCNFQQDNSVLCAARHRTQFLLPAGTEMLDWPAGSPVVSPIEHVWHTVGRKLQRLFLPLITLDEVRDRVKEAWNRISQDNIDHLPRSPCYVELQNVIIKPLIIKFLLVSLI